MRDSVVTVQAMSSVAVQPDGNAALTLADGSRFLLPKADPRSGVWNALIVEVQKYGGPVAVEYHPGTKALVDLYWPSRKKIHSVGPRRGEQEQVMFVMSPSTYYMDTARPNYAEMRALLAVAAAGHSELLVTVNGATREVIDARLPTPR